MRVTNSNMTNRYIQNMQSNSKRLDKINTQLSSQSVINKVSDDPYKAIQAINLKNEISNVEKLNSNSTEILGWAEHTDGTLDTIGSTISEIKTLLLSVNSGSQETEIKSIQKEIIEKTKQISELFNATYGGQNIFSGSATGDKAVEIDTPATGGIIIQKTATANNDSLKCEISPGVSITYNITVDEVTNNGELFDTLNEAISIFNTMPINMDKLNKLQDKLDSSINLILDARSTTGAKMNSIENMRENNTANLEKMTETLSIIKDVDVVEKSVELKAAELAYSASLQVGVKLLQNTILDYIR